MSQTLNPNKLKEAKFPESTKPEELKFFEDYKVRKEDKHLYHVALLPKGFDQRTGTRTSPVQVQQYSTTAFNTLSEGDGFMAYEAVVIHEPVISTK